MEDINVYVDLRYQNKWIQEIFEGHDIVSVGQLLEKVEQLNDELNEVKTDFEIFKQDVEDNYKRISIEEQLDITDKDFI